MSVIAGRIHLIEPLSTDQDATIRLLDKVVHCLVEDERHNLSGLQEKLREFEVRYALPTEEFQQRFNSGELGDEMDFFEWDGIADMAARLAEKLASLREADRVR